MNYEKTVFWDLLKGYVAYKKNELKNCETLEDLKKPKKSFFPLSKTKKKALERERKQEEEKRRIQQEEIDKCEKRNELVLVLSLEQFNSEMKEITGYMSSPNKDDLIEPVTRLRMNIEQVKEKYGHKLYENFELIHTYIEEFLEIIEDNSMKSMPLLKY